MRIASFNVENLFERAKALNLESWTPGTTVPVCYMASSLSAVCGLTGLGRL
jgi:hypothetical protein